MIKEEQDICPTTLGGMLFPSLDEINNRYVCEFGNVLLVSFAKCRAERKTVLEKLTQNESRLDNHGIFYSSIIEYENKPSFEQSTCESTGYDTNNESQQRIYLRFQMFRDFCLQRTLVPFLFKGNCAVIVVMPLSSKQGNNIEKFKELVREIQVLAKETPVFLVGTGKFCTRRITCGKKDFLKNELGNNPYLKVGFPNKDDYFFHMDSIVKEGHFRLIDKIMDNLVLIRMPTDCLDWLMRLEDTHKIISYTAFQHYSKEGDEELEAVLKYLIGSSYFLEGGTTNRTVVLDVPSFFKKLSVISYAENDEKIESFMNDLKKNCSVGCRNEVPIFQETGIIGHTLLTKLFKWNDPTLTQREIRILFEASLAKNVIMKMNTLPVSVEDRCATGCDYYVLPSQIKKYRYRFFYLEKFFYLPFLIKSGAILVYIIMCLNGVVATVVPIDLACKFLLKTLKIQYKNKSIKLARHCPADLYLFFMCTMIKRALELKYTPFIVRRMSLTNTLFTMQEENFNVKFLENAHYKVYFKKKREQLKIKVVKLVEDTYAEIRKVFGTDIGCQCEFN